MIWCVPVSCSYNKITGKICQIYFSWYQGQNTGCSIHIALPSLAVLARLRKLWNTQWHQQCLSKPFVPGKTWPKVFLLKENESKKRISSFHHSSFIPPRAWVLSDATPATDLAVVAWKILEYSSWSKQLACIPCSANAGCNLPPSGVILLMQPRLL